MNFHDWIRSKGKTFPIVCRELQVYRSQLERWALRPENPRHVIPRPAMMIRIFELTSGDVAPNDFYDLPLEIILKSGEPDGLARAP